MQRAIDLETLLFDKFWRVHLVSLAEGLTQLNKSVFEYLFLIVSQPSKVCTTTGFGTLTAPLRITPYAADFPLSPVGQHHPLHNTISVDSKLCDFLSVWN